MITAKTEQGYCCTCDLLPGWMVASEGTLDEFKKEVSESVDFFVRCAKEDGAEYPSFLDGEYEILYSFDVRALLCFLRGLMTFASIERITGINQKQLAHYAAGRSVPRAEQRSKIESGLRRFGLELSEIRVS